MFAAALDDLFADPHLARPAAWRPGGTGAPRSVRVIPRQPDRVAGLGAARLAVTAVGVEVRTAEMPDPRPGDVVTLDGHDLVVQGEPLADGLRLVWTLELAPP